MQMLRSQLYEIELKKQLAALTSKQGRWKLNPRFALCDAAHKLVKDVRTGYETSNVDGVMNGENDLKSLFNDDGKKTTKTRINLF
jgi:peptide chain release factor 2